MEALILRRNYPVSVTFADLRRAATNIQCPPAFWWPTWSWFKKWGGKVALTEIKTWWHAALKSATGATDDVYAVVDGCEVHLGRVPDAGVVHVDGSFHQRRITLDLLNKADEQGYWARPHEVRLDLQERAPSLKVINAVVQRSQIEAEVRRGH